MLDKVLRIAAVTLSSGLTIFLSYKQLPVTLYQQIIAVLLIVLVVVISRFSNFSNFSKSKKRLMIFCILFLSTLFIQLLIISTGGLFSPFFILFHLFALSISFLLDNATFLAFLASVCLVTGIDLKLNPFKLQLLKDDPGKTLLLGISLFIIIPLAQFISKKYHIKEELSKLLSKQVKMDEGIFENLNELVLITNKDLKAVFVNDALKKILDLTDNEFKLKDLFEILNLKNLEGKKISKSDLSIDAILKDGAGRILNNFLLYTNKKVTPFKVNIRIRPITDSESKISQLSFVITEGSTFGDLKEEHIDLKRAEETIKLHFDSFKKQFESIASPALNIQAELVEKAQEDLFLAKEVEDHPIKEQQSLSNVAVIAKQVVQEKQKLAKALQVPLTVELPGEEDNDLDRSISDFLVPIDGKWLKILINKVIDLSLLLSSGVKPSKVFLRLSKISPYINIVCSGNFPTLKEEDKELLLKLYYGNLNETTNLKFGSGLEGFIIKSIVTQLNLDFEIRLNPKLNDLAFIIKFTQNTRL